MLMNAQALTIEQLIKELTGEQKIIPAHQGLIIPTS